ncbi:ATP-dependent Clp protease proteolytic subunit [Aerococcus urinaeequi]|uniref:ATP-dependent Clp protease proteolytic subunit n=1 Tax=Aerococcus urinaeequi TaxID=51665 RepID=UPI003D6C0DF2
MRGNGDKCSKKMEITANEITIKREKINRIIWEENGQPIDKVEQDVARDYWLSTQEAYDYGIINNIITT